MNIEPISYIDSEISAAVNSLITEHSQVVKEIDAFKRFENIVSKTNVESNTVNSANTIDQQISMENKCKKICAAYKKTVMSVSHYENEYNDTYISSIEEEFGTDIAIALTQTSCFTHITKTSLLSSINNNINERENLLDAILLEKESIVSFHKRIQNLCENIESLSNQNLESLDFGALDAYWTQTNTLFKKCDRMASERQEKIQHVQTKIFNNDSGLDIHEYFYQSLSTSYPVLAAIGKVGKKIKSIRDNIYTTIIHSNFS